MSVELQEEQLSPEALAKARLDFAERCFINAQELSRFMDQKAFFLLQAVALLTAALGIVAARSFDTQPNADWHLYVKGLATFFFLVYIVLAFAVIFNATRVYRVLSEVLPYPTSNPGLIFPMQLLSRFKADDPSSEKQYLSRLKDLGSEDILHDYANQIMEISAIYQRKQKQVNRSTGLFYWLTICWVVTMLLLLASVILM